MKLPKSHQEIMALRQLALEDLMVHSDEQLRQEAMADGENADVLATALRAELREAAAHVLRQRLIDAKQRMVNSAKRPVKPVAYPTFEILQRLIRSAFESQPELGLAFREGKEQSEADWQSLYDDLIELGAIVPNEDSH